MKHNNYNVSDTTIQATLLVAQMQQLSMTIRRINIKLAMIQQRHIYKGFNKGAI